MFFNTAALVAASLAATTHAHMFISSPVPIPGSAPKDPLDASGSNFPCHGVTLPTSGGHSMPAGSSQLLAWNLGGGLNTAVHGGGSCQISITYETDAQAIKDPKNWFVIYSIEGGCPSNTVGNLDGSYTGPDGTYTGAIDCTDPKTNGVDCVNQFNFTIPKGIKAGNSHATLAWTWYNTIGNRELYMNCASVQLSGGDGSEMSSFPSMFVANMASVDACPSVEGENLKFPYPGKYLTTKLPSGAGAKTATTYPIVAPSGAGCAGDGKSVGGGAAAVPPSNGGHSPPAAAPSAIASAAPSAGASSGAGPTYGSGSPSQAAASGGPLVTVTTMQTVTSGAAGSASSGSPMSSAAASAPPSQAPSAAAPSASAAPPASSAAAPSGGSSSGSCANGAVSCPNPGAVVCVGSGHFGLCNINKCAVPQALAAGTHCANGEIRKRDIGHRHVARHAARRHL